MKVELRSSFEGLATAWEELRARSNADHLFLSYDWQHTWWSVFGDQGQLHLILLWDGPDLAAVAPFYRTETTLRLIGGLELSDYLDLMYRPEAAAALFETLHNHLAEAGLLDLDLGCLPAASPTMTYLAPERLPAGYQVRVEEHDVCPALDLPADWETYLAGLTKKDRHELRRKLRRLAAQPGVRLTQVASLAELTAAWPDFFRLQALSRPEKAAFQTPTNRLFFERIGAVLFPYGQFRLYFLEVAGRRVASVICFAQENELWLYNSGYDPEFGHLSVGLLSKAACLRAAIAEGKSRFDFLRGREKYKYDLGATDRPLYRVRLARG